MNFVENQFSELGQSQPKHVKQREHNDTSANHCQSNQRIVFPIQDWVDELITVHAIYVNRWMILWSVLFANASTSGTPINQRKGCVIKAEAYGP